jgi:hypothetical protein
MACSWLCPTAFPRPPGTIAGATTRTQATTLAAKATSARSLRAETSRDTVPCWPGAGRRTAATFGDARQDDVEHQAARHVGGAGLLAQAHHAQRRRAPLDGRHKQRVAQRPARVARQVAGVGCRQPHLRARLGRQAPILGEVVRRDLATCVPGTQRCLSVCLCPSTRTQSTAGSSAPPQHPHRHARASGTVPSLPIWQTKCSF